MDANYEVWVGDSLLSFDGRVLEVFGYQGQDSFRYHARNLLIDIGEPDKKGKRMVQLRPRTKGVGCALAISMEDWAHAAQLLERLQEAAADEGGGRPS
jgi:hypothetical protein